MARTTEDDQRMRAEFNQVIALLNGGQRETALTQLESFWRTYFESAAVNLSDYDVLGSAARLMRQVMPESPVSAAADRLFQAFEDANKLNRPYYARYDLSKWPPQFDVFSFLVQAKTLAGARPLHVVFVPGEGGYLVRTGKYSNDEAVFRMQHICFPACQVFGASATLLPTREAQVPDGDWLDDVSHDHRGVMDVFDRVGHLARVKSTTRARELVSGFTSAFSKPILTITVRNTFRNVGRNTDMDAWMTAADRLSADFDVVIVPDTQDAFSDLGLDHPVFPIGAVDLDCRLALYEHAAMNLFNSNGPAVLGLFGTIPFIEFGVRSEASVPAHYWEYLRLPIGSQPPYLMPGQKLVWETPDTDMIVSEVESVIRA